jgi:hypothetical protein
MSGEHSPSGEPKPHSPDNASSEALPAPTETPPSEECLETPEAVAAYRKILRVKGEAPSAPSAAPNFSYWNYPTFDASLDEAAEGQGRLEAPNDLLEAARAAASGKEKGKSAHKKKKKKAQKLKLQIAHRTAGRVRMKISGAKGNPDVLREVAENFRIIPGIEQIAINPVTGSIILHYDEDNQKAFNDRLTRSMMAHGGSSMLGSEFEELARKIENEAEFLAQRSEAARAIVSFFKQMDRDIKVTTHNVVDLKIVLAVGVIGLTIFEVGAHAATPVWLTLSIFTFNHFLELRAPAEEGEPAVAMAPVVLKG